jgi:hypothetical protein
LKTKNIIWIALAAVFVVVGLVLIVNSLRKPAAPAATTTPTQDANAVLTGVARTADAKMTEMAAITPSPLPATETLTPVPATPTSPPTAEVLPSTPTSAGGLPSVDQATFVADVTVPDGSNFSPGQSFVKTWRLKNTGATSWSTSFKLAFLQGDQMGGPASVPVPRVVAPNESVDISVSLVAPLTAGHYRGYWKMRNASDQSFQESIYVDINVVGSGTITATPGTPTASVTPGPTATTGAATPTPTTGTPTVTITNLTLSVDNANYTGACPHTFVLTGQFNLNTAASVTYQLEAQTTPQITLAPAQTVQLIPGPAQLVFNVEQNASFTGTIWLHITAPTNVTSNQVSITLTCQ